MQNKKKIAMTKYVNKSICVSHCTYVYRFDKRRAYSQITKYKRFFYGYRLLLLLHIHSIVPVLLPRSLSQLPSINHGIWLFSLFQTNASHNVCVLRGKKEHTTALSICYHSIFTFDCLKKTTKKNLKKQKKKLRTLNQLKEQTVKN